ncbi:putative ABC transporter extracellular-binding protein YurO [Vallitalea longa]|uniref:Probable sugar-binding periplasmic protein n=1 Tax=Vallitalea longa TaxID=2936439 RepID=A0A9W6DEY9_9FIRM|nr:ABC transporter substrate-binding protein [Vallitalea longa]GKX28923.1 putative ABC transporter extracellular-binding protein YurO [Vallitalea longa]
MKKILVCLLTVVLSISLLGGCSKKTKTTGDTKVVPDKEYVENNDEKKKEEKVTIKWLHHWGEEGVRQWLQELETSYEKTHPNVDIEITAAGGDNYYTLLKTKIASDDAPDIYDVDLIADQEFIDNNYLTDLTDAPFIPNIQKSVIDSVQKLGNGKVLAIPLDVWGAVVTYNKDVFEKAGITKAPATNKEFNDALEKLKNIGVDPIGASYQDRWTLDWELQNDYVVSILGNYDEEWIKKVQSRELKFQDDKNGFREVLERLKQRYQYVNRDPFGTDWNTVQDKLATGEIGMLINGTWTVGGVQAKNPDVNLGVMALPVFNEPNANKVVLGVKGGLAVHNGSKNKEVVYDFFNHIFSKSMAKIYQDKKVALSTVEGVELDSDSCFNSLVEYQNNDQVVDMSYLLSSFQDEFGNAFIDQISLYLLENMTEDACIEALDKEFDKIAERQ